MSGKFQTSLKNLLDSWKESIVAHSSRKNEDFQKEGGKISKSKAERDD